MRRLIMWNVITLVGYFEGRESWSLDWHEEVWGDELEQFFFEQLRGADMLLFDRVTYEGMAAYWPTAGSEVEVARMMNELLLAPVVLGSCSSRTTRSHRRRGWSRTSAPGTRRWTGAESARTAGRSGRRGTRSRYACAMAHAA